MPQFAAQVFYLAYGSNLHPLRLQRRVPSAVLLGAVALPGRRVQFDKLGQDGSGKCRLVDAPQSTAHGALYTIDPDEMARLDVIEGVGKGYRNRRIELEHEGRTVAAHCYMATASHVDARYRPFTWYRDLVIAGGRFLALPSAYVDDLAAVVAVNDPDAARRGENEALLSAMRGHVSF